jgi:hypothetical protein
MLYHGKPHGVCRRNPPVGGEFPEVHGDSMCGEWSDKNITPEQTERRELVRQFAVAIVAGDFGHEGGGIGNKKIWECAQQIVDAEMQT